MKNLRELLGLPTDGTAPETFHHPQTQMAVALAVTEHDPSRTYGPRHVYAGTVPDAVVARRRKKNKQAARSRRTNRGRR